MKKSILTEIPVKVHGRTNGCLDPLTLFWTASGVELNVKASELWMTFRSDYNTHEPWISIEINGDYVSRLMLPKGENHICIFRNMNPERIKNVRIYKDVQAMSGDEKHLLQVLSVETDGSFEPVADRPHKIEFLGDSITSGEGLFGAKPEEDWISMFFGAVPHYAKQLADGLNAEYRVISQSGWGTLCGWDNNPHCALPNYYEQVCGLAFGPQNEALGAQKPNDFSAWQPEIVVINLGTNDEGAFHTPKWVDVSTGESFDQVLLPDETYEEASVKRFQQAVIKTLTMLRKNNPQALLCWTYGMLGHGFVPIIRQAIDQYQKNTQDTKVTFVLLPDTTDETIGARFHPGKAAHTKAATTLMNHLGTYLK